MISSKCEVSIGLDWRCLIGFRLTCSLFVANSGTACPFSFFTDLLLLYIK